MKIKRIFSALVSAALCFSLFTTNVAALETNEDFTSVSEAVEQTIDISQISEYANMEVTNQNYDVVPLSITESDSRFEELPNVESPISESMIADENIAVPYATPNPLSTLGVIKIWLGDSSVLSSTKGKWKSVYTSSSPDSSLSCSIDTTNDISKSSTDFKYIRFRIYQWGYTTSLSKQLDKLKPVSSINIAGLNSSGNVSSAGEIVYGFLNDYVFEIPVGKKFSNAKFVGYYNQNGSNVTRTATVNIKWTTPTDPAPTTPSLTYDAHPDYAIVTGVDTSMEYRARFDNNDEEETYSYSDWTAFTGTALYFPIFDYAYTIQIRYKVAANGIPSLNCEIPVLARSAAPDSYFYYNSVIEIFEIYASDKQIEIALGDGTLYFAVSPARYSIEEFIDEIPEGGFNRIYIRYAATAAEPASISLVLTLYGRNPNTPDSVYYENGALYNLTPDVALRFNGGAWYNTQLSSVNVTSFMSSTETTLLEIRYMPTESASCSATREIILPILA